MPFARRTQEDRQREGFRVALKIQRRIDRPAPGEFYFLGWNFCVSPVAQFEI
jgi:hypothetical protein